MSKRGYFITFLVTGFMALILFHVKYRVINLEKDLKKVNQEVVSTQENIHVLKAEWGYLNRPDRIHKLSDKYLRLKKRTKKTYVNPRNIPNRVGMGLQYSSRYPYAGARKSKQGRIGK